MKTTTKSILAVAVIAVTASVAVPYAMADDDDKNDCRWGKRGMHHTSMFGGHHKGFGMFGGKGMRGDLELTADRTKEIIEGLIAWQGNENLKVGEIKELDDKTISATVVTKEGSLVQKVEIDRSTGRPKFVR